MMKVGRGASFQWINVDWKGRESMGVKSTFRDIPEVANANVPLLEVPENGLKESGPGPNPNRRFHHRGHRCVRLDHLGRQLVRPWA